MYLLDTNAILDSHKVAGAMGPIVKCNSKQTSSRRLPFSVLLIVACVLPVLSQDDQRQAALSLEHQERFAEAESAWNILSRKNPSNPEPFAHLGFLEARQEHYPEAIVFYHKAMVLNSSMPGLRLNLGLALYKIGEYEQSIQMFGPLLKAQSGDQRLTILVGMAEYGRGKYAAAVPHLKRASARDPQNLALLLALGHSCLLSKQFQCVVDAYHRIVSLNAESAEADMLGGEALDEMKDTIGATREFRAAVKANPKEPNVHFGLGYLLWTQRQYTEAAQEFQAELNNDPEHVQANLYLADAEIQLNQMEEAAPLLEKLVKTNPTMPMAHLDLGIVYSEIGRREDALKELQMAATMTPADVNVHWRLGRLYRSMGRMEQAKIEFEKARRFNKAANDRLLEVIPATVAKGGSPDRAAGRQGDK